MHLESFGFLGCRKDISPMGLFSPPTSLPSCCQSALACFFEAQVHLHPMEQPLVMKGLPTNMPQNYPRFTWAVIKTLMTSHYTDWFIGIVRMTWYNPYITGQFHPLYTLNSQGFGYFPTTPPKVSNEVFSGIRCTASSMKPINPIINLLLFHQFSIFLFRSLSL